jgi:hypothetical protein
MFLVLVLVLSDVIGLIDASIKSSTVDLDSNVSVKRHYARPRRALLQLLRKYWPILLQEIAQAFLNEICDFFFYIPRPAI